MTIFIQGEEDALGDKTIGIFFSFPPHPKYLDFKFSIYFGRLEEKCDDNLTWFLCFYDMKI
jgi:hypothetical protein